MKTILLSILLVLVISGVWYGMAMSEEKGWCECMDNQLGINTHFEWFGGCQFESDALDMFVPYEA